MDESGDMTELLRVIAADTAFLRADITFLRRAIEPLLPLADALRGNGQIDAVRAAGLRKTLRRAARDAT